MKRLQVGKVDYKIVTISLALLAFGLIAVSSASSVLSYERFGHNNYYFFRQLAFGAVPGLIMMYMFSRFKYSLWQKISPLLALAAIALLVAVLLPGVGFQVGNAKRWINLGFFLFQPAEFAKFAMIFYLVSWYDKRQHHVHNFYYGFLPTLTIVGIVAGLIILEPDIGTMLVLAAIAGVMFYVGGVKFRYLLATAGVGLVSIWVLIQAAPYRMERIITFFNPEHDAAGISYQINQARLAIGSGGLWGYGFGQSRQKYNYLP